MSPVMVGRARPFARLAGIVEAAEVMTGDQPAVALVSGEPGIGKTRLVRELVAVAAGAVTTLAVTAQPGSMGRPLDAVAALVEPGLHGDDLADGRVRRRRRGGRSAARRCSSSRTCTGSTRPAPTSSTASPSSRGRTSSSSPRTGPTTCRAASPAASSCCASSAATPSSRSASTASTAPRSARWSRRSRRPPAREPSSAFVEALHRRSGGIPFVVEELMRVVGPRRDRVRPPRRRAAVVARGGGAPAARGLEHGRRRVVEALAVYGRAASFEALLTVTEADRGRPARRPPRARRRRRRRRGQRRPVLVLPRPRRRRHRPPAARPGAPAAPRALLRGRAAGAGARPRLARLPRPGRRPPRRGPGDRPSRRRPLPREGADVLRAAAGRRGPGRGAERPRAARRRHRGGVAARLRRRGAGTATRWLKVAVEVLDRIEAMRFVARLHHELDDEAASLARLRDLEALWASLDDAQLRGVAGAAHRPGAHDQRPGRRRPSSGPSGRSPTPGRPATRSPRRARSSSGPAR